MYIEVTTIAIPTFLITGLKIAAAFAIVWLVIVGIGITIYMRGEK